MRHCGNAANWKWVWVLSTCNVILTSVIMSSVFQVCVCVRVCYVSSRGCDYLLCGHVTHKSSSLLPNQLPCHCLRLHFRQRTFSMTSIKYKLIVNSMFHNVHHFDSRIERYLSLSSFWWEKIVTFLFFRFQNEELLSRVKKV